MFILYLYFFSTSCFAGIDATPVTSPPNSCRHVSKVVSTSVAGPFKRESDCETALILAFQETPLSVAGFCGEVR